MNRFKLFSQIFILFFALLCCHQPLFGQLNLVERTGINLPPGNDPNGISCPILYSEENFTGQRYYLNSLIGMYRPPFKVKSVKMPPNKSWEVQYYANEDCREAYQAVDNGPFPLWWKKITENQPIIKDICHPAGWILATVPGKQNRIKLNITTGGDDLRAGSKFYLTVLLKNGKKLPEVPFPTPESGTGGYFNLKEKEERTFYLDIPKQHPNYTTPVTSDMIKGIILRFDGSPLGGGLDHYFDTYDNWDIHHILFFWNDTIYLGGHRPWPPTRLTGENKSINWTVEY